MSDEPGSSADATGGGSRRGRAHVEASRRVAQIMRAAEDAATQLRDEAERRADARIAEASRAAELRVDAAEEEAREILTEARRRAADLEQHAREEAERVRTEAAEEAARVLGDANANAAEVQRIAEVFAKETRDKADQDARRQVVRAKELANEVLADGSEMSHNLRQLSESLRRNAETILVDVQRAHRAMTARLAESGYDLGGSSSAPSRSAAPDVGDVPEFVPRTPRRDR
jgi:vacuolar-type H+-ATPase subunit H